MSFVDTLEYKWEHSEGQREATEIEDREYIVFRGNAPMVGLPTLRIGCIPSHRVGGERRRSNAAMG